MWRFICPELLRDIDTEPENEVLLVMLDSLARCIQKLGPSYISQESMAEILRIIDKFMTEHFERAIDRHKKHLDEDYDEVSQFSTVLTFPTFSVKLYQKSKKIIISINRNSYKKSINDSEFQDAYR